MKLTTWLLALALLSLAAPEPAKVAGVWDLSLEIGSITGHPVVTFKQDGEKLTGTYAGHYGESAIEGTVKNKEIEFSVTILAEGTRITGAFGGTVDGDKMGGTVSYEGAGDGTWAAVRKPAK